MKNPFSLIAGIAGVIDDPNKPVEWEHGWKTSRITATRYNNPHMGLNIGFSFPKNPNDCDRADLSDFIEAHKGWVYQSGGHVGAEMYAKFKDVTDIESANRKLKEILPAFNQLMQDVTDGKKIPPIVNPDAKVWPDCDPPEGGVYRGGMQCNGTHYMKAEVSPGKWQWVVDEVEKNREYDHENHRSELWCALSTRALTQEELVEVGRYGTNLNIPLRQPFNREEKLQELHNALLIQQMLQSAAALPDLRVEEGA